MSKISIEKQVPIKKLWVLMFLPMLFSCTTPCPSSSDLSPYNCDKCNGMELFSSCIKKNFPLGSSYSELSDYLTKIGFVKAKSPDDIKNRKFYFFWWGHDLGNVKIVILGRYNEQLKIIEIHVS